MHSTNNSTASSTTSSIAIAGAATIATACVVVGHKITKAKAKTHEPIFTDIPYAPDGHWLFGHLGTLNKDGNFVEGYRKVFEEYADETTGLISFWFANQPSIAVLLSRDVKAVLISTSFREPSGIMKAHNDKFLGANALVQLVGKEWKLYRSAVHKSFTSPALRQSQHSIVQVGTTLVNSLLAKINNDNSSSPTSSLKQIQHCILPLMKMATMDVFGLVALDTDFQCCAQLQLTAVGRAFEYMSADFTRRLSNPHQPTNWLYGIPTAANRKHHEQRTVIRTFLAEQIEKTRKTIQESNAGNGKHDLLANILRANESSNDLSDDGIMDILMTMLFGGYDTTSIALSYALYLLAKHPTAQTHAVQEVAVVTSDDAWNGDSALPYIRAIVLETLRMYPPAPLTSRNLETDMVLSGNTTITKGTPVFVPIWSIQRDARNFPKPTEFRPERWVRRNDDNDVWEERPSDDNDSDSDVPPANTDAFCVFAAGARNCVGRKLAMQEAVALLALLIRKLEFRLVDESYVVQPKSSFAVQQPHDNLPMKISPCV